MNYTNRGSALVMVLLVITMLTFVAAALWRSADLIMETALQRVIHEQQARATETTLTYGIALCKENMAALCRALSVSKAVNVDCTKLLADTPLKARYRSQLKITYAGDNHLALEAQLYRGSEKQEANDAISTLSCHVQEQEISDDKSATMVTAWRSGDAPSR